MKENRIYVDDKLMALNSSDFGTMCDYTSLVKKYGKERVKIVQYEEIVDDEERMNFLIWEV